MKAKPETIGKTRKAKTKLSKVSVQAARLKILADASQAFAAVGQDYHALLDQVARQVTEALADVCIIRLVSDNGLLLEFAALYSPDPEYSKSLREMKYYIPDIEAVDDPGLALHVLRSGESAFVPLVSVDQLRASIPPEYWSIYEPFAPHSYMIVPLNIQGRNIGIMSLTRYRSEQPSFTRDELSLAQDLASRAALTINSARLFDQVQKELDERKQAEDQLRASEYSLKRSQAVAHVGDWSWDTQSNQVTWSDEMHRIFGINPEAFNGDLNDIIAKAIHPDDREKVAHSNESVINEQAPARLEYRVVWPDESVHTVLAIPGERFTDEKGNILRLTGVVQDITERKRAEERLHLQNERFLHFTNSNIVGIVIAEAGGKIVLANDYYLKLLDVNRQDFIDGKVDWRKFTPSEWLPADEKAISELYERGVCEPYEKEYVRSDGTRVSVYIADAMLPGPEEQIAAFVIDITERKRAEKQIVQMKRLYATLSQVNQTIVRVKDRVDLYQSICEVAVQFGEFSLVWVGLLDEVSGEIRPVAAVGQDINHWPFDAINIRKEKSKDELIVEAICNSKVVTSEDIGNDERIKSQTELIQKYGYHSTAVVPFRLRGKTIGVVSLVSGIKGFFKYEDEIRLLDEMGLDISFALDTMETEAERKEVEASLRNSQNLLQDIIDHTPSLVYELDTNGRFILANQRLGTLFGLADRQVIGKTRADILPLEIANEHRKNDVQVINSRQASLFEEENQEADGKHFYLTLKFPLIDADDKVYAVCGISTDITERRQVDEKIQVQLQRLSALREIDRAISSSMDLRLSLDILLTQVLSQLYVDAASVLLLNPASQTFEYFTGKGFRTLNIHQSRTRLGEGLAGRAGLERKLFHIPNLAELDSQFHRREFLKGEEFVEYFGVPLIAKGMLKGVLEIFHRSHLNPDLDWLNYLETIGGQAAIAIDNIQLFEETQKSNLELIRAYDATIEGWSRAMDLRDKETEGHSLRVTELTVQLAIKLGVGQQEMTQLRRGALLHDIGKLGIPDNILLKPDKLTDFEWAIMRQHPSYAYKMLLPIAYLRPALDIPYCHHEKWDGTGYPRGLREEQIPLSARIFAIVDVWDALRSDRPYRASWTIEKTREHIIEESGKHFDPQVVEAFLRLLDEFPDLR